MDPPRDQNGKPKNPAKFPLAGMIPVQPPARNADESARTKTRNSRGIANREADTMDERKRDETIAGQVAEARWKTLPLYFERQRNRGRETKRKIWRGRERETKIGKHSRWRESFSRCFSRGCIGCGGLQPALEGLCTAGRGDGKEDGGWRGSFCRRQRWCGLSLLPLSYSSLPVSLLPSLTPPPRIFPLFTFSPEPTAPRHRLLAPSPRFSLRPSSPLYLATRHTPSFHRRQPPRVRIEKEEKDEEEVEEGGRSRKGGVVRGTPGWRHY